ncbi:MAG: phosphate/phosphite/phosphonate ABC transporter substrate-binding protein [Nevskia sp.]|nr:phosphate/phosphite/phosphonate ABC transporter substrate-binding protein [Nevskia sp.]
MFNSSPAARAVAALCFLLTIENAAAAEPLRVGMIPDAGATQVSVEQKAPLQKYLEQQMGMPVKLVIPTSYNATVEGLGNGSLDIAYFGGLTYVKAHERYGAVPLVQRDVDQQFQALFITRKATGIKSLADLKGKTFCFGDINSTSGHLFPYLAMKQAGISVDADLKSTRYTGSHAATAQAVAAGVCDAGSLDETVFKSMVADGKIPGESMRVFFTTPPFADYVWAARKDLSPALQEKFSAALLRLQPGRDDAILEILRGEHYVKADDAEYDDVRKVGKELGLL